MFFLYEYAFSLIHTFCQEFTFIERFSTYFSTWQDRIQRNNKRSKGKVFGFFLDKSKDKCEHCRYKAPNKLILNQRNITFVVVAAPQALLSPIPQLCLLLYILIFHNTNCLLNLNGSFPKPIFISYRQQRFSPPYHTHHPFPNHPIK